MAWTPPTEVDPGDAILASLWNSDVKGNTTELRNVQKNVVRAVKTDTQTFSSTTFTDVTGLSVTITPTSATSSILILATLNASGQAGVNSAHARLVRGSTAIGVGAAGGSRQVASWMHGGDEFTSICASFMWLDEDADTTSATTYKIQLRANNSNAGYAVYVNRQQNDSTDSTATARLASSLVVMEIAT